jgi:hypothetical protein
MHKSLRNRNSRVQRQSGQADYDELEHRNVSTAVQPPGLDSPNGVIAMQRAVGNRATVRMMKSAPPGAAQRHARQSGVVQRTPVPSVQRESPTEAKTLIEDFVPEGAFIEDYSQRSAPKPITDPVGDQSILRRHDPWPPLVDPFIASYNYFTIPAMMFQGSMNYLTKLMTDSALSPDPAKLSPQDRQKMTQTQGLTREAREVEGPSVTSAMDSLRGAFLKFEAAKTDLKGAKTQLFAVKTKHKKEEQEGKVKEVEDRIKDITETIGIVTSVAKVAVGPGTGTGFDPKDGIDAADKLVGWFVKAAYKPQLDKLKANITKLKGKLTDAELSGAKSAVESAESKLAAIEQEFNAAAGRLKSALSDRRRQYQAMGEFVDIADQKERKSDTPGDRYEYLFKMSEAVQEAVVTGVKALEATGDPGILAMVKESYKGGHIYLGFPGKSFIEWDDGQKAVGAGLSDLFSFAFWAKDNLGQLIIWSDGWKQLFSEIGTGTSVPEL